MDYKVKYTTHNTRQTLLVVSDIIKSLGRTPINAFDGAHEITIKPIKQ